MKAIAVFEMPKYCDECPCCTWIPEYSKYGCGIGGDLEDITDKPSWCPLKLMPNKINHEAHSLIEYVSSGHQYTCGWNDCLKEIIGETDNTETETD